MSMLVPLPTVKFALTLLVNLTAVAPVKFVPVIVTLLPTIPLAGLTALTVGQMLAAMVKFSVRIGAVLNSTRTCQLPNSEAAGWPAMASGAEKQPRPPPKLTTNSKA